jgi:hypothetical protein
MVASEMTRADPLRDGTRPSMEEPMDRKESGSGSQTDGGQTKPRHFLADRLPENQQHHSELDHSLDEYKPRHIATFSHAVDDNETLLREVLPPF